MGGRGYHCPPMPEVSVVTVLYNSADVVEACLASLPYDVEVVVVDNASADDGAERALAARPDAIVVRSPQNLGFGGGCNLGWRRATGRYIAFINPDVRLAPGALEALVRRLASEPRASVGPAMLDAGGRPRRVKLPASPLADFLAMLPAAGRWNAGRDGRLAASAPLHEQGGEVSHVEGACFAIRREDLEAIGGFDEDLFLYDEEESLALRLAALGGRALYDPSVAVEHSGAHATERVSSLATRHMYRSRVLLYRKRDGRPRAIAAAAAIALAVVLALPVAVVNTVLRRERLLTLAHLVNVMRGIASGLACVPRSGVVYPAPGRGRRPARR